jgi:hypothetical protein
MRTDDLKKLIFLLQHIPESSEALQLQSLVDSYTQHDPQPQATPTGLHPEPRRDASQQLDSLRGILGDLKPDPGLDSEAKQDPSPPTPRLEMAGHPRTAPMYRMSIRLPKESVRGLISIGRHHCLNTALLDAQTATTKPFVGETELDGQRGLSEPGNPLNKEDRTKPYVAHSFADMATSRSISIDSVATAPSKTIAYLLDIFLELHAPNWQSAIWKAERPEKNDWFKGRNPITRKVIDELIRHIQVEKVSSNNRTIGKHLEAALNLVDTNWQEPVVYTKGGLEKVYRTIFGLSQAVIGVAELNSVGRINRGIENPAKKAAKLFQRIAHLPDGLTEEQLVDCLDASWKLYSDRHSGGWSA